LKLLGEFVRKLVADTGAVALFPKKPTIPFHPEVQACPSCGARLHVQKTRKKTVVTMDIGAFTAKEIILFCPNDQTVSRSEQLRGCVPEKGTFGFDVIVAVGLSLFVHCRGHRETMQELASRNVHLSEREIGYLGRKFIFYLALSHQRSQAGLRNWLAKNGGYILHIDGTCEGDSPFLFCGLDGISELILDTIKISSEKKVHLVPFFKRIREQYGLPLALVHDMAKGIISAVEEVFPGVPDYICHFHFLRDIGKDLLLEDYTAFAKRLRKFKVRSLLRQRLKHFGQKVDKAALNLDAFRASLESGQWRSLELEHIPVIITCTLIRWVLDYSCESGGYGFPFDRPHLDFYRRLQRAHELLDAITNTRLSGRFKDNKPFYQVYRLFKPFVEDKRLNTLAAELEEKAEVFDKLREAMRIALPESGKGVNDDGGDNIKSIEQKVTAFRKWLTLTQDRKATYAKMISQIDKYKEKLFADPLPVVTPDGVIYVQPQRTNNILEQFFREEKRRGRKRTGKASLNKELKTILAGTPLVRNLDNSAYMDLILDGCADLPERFSQIEAALVKKEMQKMERQGGKVLSALNGLFRDSELPVKIGTLLAEIAK